MKRTLLTGFVLVFLCFWLSFFVSGLAHKGCVERPTSDAKKSSYCSTAIIAGAWIDLFPSERAKRAPLLLHRGLISLAAGEMEAAKQDFRQALLNAAIASNQASCLSVPRDLALPRVAWLLNEMRQIQPNSPEARVWQDTIREISCAT
jgi:hypothetical protein